MCAEEGGGSECCPCRASSVDLRLMWNGKNPELTPQTRGHPLSCGDVVGDGGQSPWTRGPSPGANLVFFLTAPVAKVPKGPSRNDLKVSEQSMRVVIDVIISTGESFQGRKVLHEINIVHLSEARTICVI
jgi:hypothetical protein